MLKQRQTEAGFSLIEVLVALVILAIGVLGVAGLQIAALSQSAESNRQGLAALHLQSAADSLLMGESKSEVQDMLNDVLDDAFQLGQGCANDSDNHVHIAGTSDNGSTLYSIQIGWIPQDADAVGDAVNDDGCVVVTREVRVNG